MREGVLAHDGLVGLHANADDFGQELTGGKQLFRLDASCEGQDVVANLERHDEFLKRRVARAFADAVDRAFHLPRAVLDGDKRIGDREAEVVVAMNADDGVLDVGDVVVEMHDERAELRDRRNVSRRLQCVARWQYYQAGRDVQATIC